MDYTQDERIVMTLDAGGTKFAFSAVQRSEEIMPAVTVNAESGSLEELLKKIIDGFREVRFAIDEPPVAISFAFPGPADFENGIIGDLQNLPFFRGGVALKNMLENAFGIPVFINNDGDLFAYGEAMSGFLPRLNALLRNHGIHREYRNLLGVTLGTGFGGGIVHRGHLFMGDNSAAGEINRTRNYGILQTSIEDSVSIRAIKRVYAREAGIEVQDTPEARVIYQIASGELRGHQQAARKAFTGMAGSAADAIANAVSLVDGPVVIGGGLSGAYPVFLDTLVENMNRHFITLSGETLERMEVTAFNFEDPASLNAFLRDTSREIPVPFSQEKVEYDPVKKIPVGVTPLGTSRAVSVGAYAFALDELNRT